MHHIEHTNKYDTAILIKHSGLREQSLRDTLITPSGLKCISFSLDYGGAKKPSAKTRKEYLGKLLPVLDSLKVKDLLVCDGEYFKSLTGVKKADPNYGYVLPCVLEGYSHLNVVLCPQPSALMFNPAMQDKIDLALATMNQHKVGSYIPLGTDIIHSEAYPESLSEISKALASLHQYPALACDIEAFSLKHYSAGLGTIAFAWDMHNGIAIPVDHVNTTPYEFTYWDNKDKKYKSKVACATANFNSSVRNLIREFFETYKGKILWHNASFDCTVLIYQLWMNGGLLNQQGLLEGLEVMTRHIDDTKIISYLATNSCAGNKLSLKDQAHEFAGNYAESNINNINLIPRQKLLRYNLIDALSTWYTYDKNHPIMVADKQQDIYSNLFMPSIKTIIQMQLTGMCLDMEKVKYAETYLTNIKDTHVNNLITSPIVIQFIQQLRQQKVDSDNLKLKTKTRLLSEVGHITFNPNSGPQVQALLYDVLKLPVIDLTDSKQPSVSGKTLKKLIHHTTDPSHKQILTDLIEYVAVDKILSAFIPRFLEAPLAEDGMHYLFGNFNLGGTVSGRLSSSGPNLQQIPSNSKYAKLIKACFVSAPGWLFCGADSASLEDRIDALQTKDPNKLKVYMGHNVYEINVNGTCHHIRDDTIINFEGKQYTAEEFYEAYSTI